MIMSGPEDNDAPLEWRAPSDDQYVFSSRSM